MVRCVPAWREGKHWRFSGFEAQVGAPAEACSQPGRKSRHLPAGTNCGQAEPISSSLLRVPEARQLLHSYQRRNSQCFMPRLRLFTGCKGDDGAVEWRLIDLVMTMSVWSLLEHDNRRESLSGVESTPWWRGDGGGGASSELLAQQMFSVWFYHSLGFVVASYGCL